MSAIEHIENGGITSATGFSAAGITAGLKPSGAKDLAVLCSDRLATAAGTFTTNVVCAPPVTVCKDKLEASEGLARAIIVNSGQANAATGVEGTQNAIRTAEEAASILGAEAKHVLVASTGVIGRQINMEKMVTRISKACKQMSPDGGDDAAKAIMTTDLTDKQIAYKVRLSSGTVIVGGMSKGSGMIHPNMATMLGFVTSDAAVESGTWSTIVKEASRKSFNQITVDGDTSTNDCLIALANGASEVAVDTQEDLKLLTETVTRCCQHLAKAIARDGEGATVLLEIRVSGAASDEDACLVARTVAGSSLVKSAIFGRDPNWGRIAAAAGRAGVDFDESELDIFLGPHQMMKSGQPVEYDTEAASKYMFDASKAEYMSGEDSVVITLSIGRGSGSGTAWGCDLSYDYVKINAEYTT